MSITAIGLQDEQKIVKRSGAKPNDLLVVTGDLGEPIWDYKYWKENMLFI